MTRLILCAFLASTITHSVHAKGLSHLDSESTDNPIVPGSIAVTGVPRIVDSVYGAIVHIKPVFLDGTNPLPREWGDVQLEQASGPLARIRQVSRGVIAVDLPLGQVEGTRTAPVLPKNETLTFQVNYLDSDNQLIQRAKLQINLRFTKQSLLYATERVLASFWKHRTQFGDESGFSTLTSVDGLSPKIFGSESEALSDKPIVTFQGGNGMPAVLEMWLSAIQALPNKAHRERLNGLISTAGNASRSTGEVRGWFQDMSLYSDGWKNIGVWGNTTHPASNYQGLITFDDSTTAGMLTALVHTFAETGNAQAGEQVTSIIQMLEELRNYEHAPGQFPYANGGIPQVLPVHRALSAHYNENGVGQNGTPTPFGPYFQHKTLNDHVMPHTIVALLEAHRVFADQRFLLLAELHLDYLLGRHEAYGSRGWAQQYHYLTDEMTWGRAKEPPAFVSGETDVIPTLLLYVQRFSNDTSKEVRVARIKNAVLSYLLFLRDDVEGCVGNPANPQYPLGFVDRNGNGLRDFNDDKILCRYYNHDSSRARDLAPTFANHWQLWFEQENYSYAGGGQPYAAVFDAAWIIRILGYQGQTDLNLSQMNRYLADFSFAPTGVRMGSNWIQSYNSLDPRHDLWTRQQSFRGSTRVTIGTSLNVSHVRALIANIGVVPGDVFDRDADGYSDEVEVNSGSDPLDSDVTPESLEP